MGPEFSAEFLAATPRERIAICLEMTVEAADSASRANGETRHAFVSLARLWSRLAKEIECAENKNSMQSKPEVDDEFNR